MASLSLNRIKAESETRMSEEKKIQERRRNILVLIEKYLLGLGYFESVQKLQNECGITLENWDLADNIDLYMILTEFEQFYEMKFAKAPKIVKKAINKQTLPKIAERPPSDKTATHTKKSSEKVLKKQSTRDLPKELPKDLPKELPNSKENNSNNMEITGNSLSKPKENKDEIKDYFESRIIPALPQDLLDLPDLRDLAMYLKRDIINENPNVRFDDIVGLTEAKRLVKEAVVIPLKYPQFFVGILEPWKGVLLFGPPGTGKTLLAKAVATECKTTFFNISASSLVSKWRGESEKLVRVLFELARYYSPSTIFIDELDALMGQRSSHENVFVLAASNLPWDLDAAMLRRLEKRILIPMPDELARKSLLEKFLVVDSIDYLSFAKKLENYSGSDIKLLSKEALMIPLRKLIQKIEDSNKNDGKNKNKKYDSEIRPDQVTEDNLLDALEKTKPSSFLNTEKYVKWQNEFGSI